MCEEPRSDATEAPQGSVSTARCVAAVMLSAMLVLELSSCAMRHAVVHEEIATPISPELAPVTEFPLGESSPVPPACRVAMNHNLRESISPPRVCQPLPPLPQLPLVSTDTERLATLEQELRQLTKTIQRHDQQISTMDTVGSQMRVTVGEQNVEIQRVLTRIRQAYSDESHRLIVISQKLSQLEAAQQVDREERDQVLDEIIRGLEQALALDASTPHRKPLETNGSHD